MVRAPVKTCPNLSYLFENAESALLAAFLTSKAFERQKWLSKYGIGLGISDLPEGAVGMLHEEKKHQLSPLEAEAARITALADERGQFALEGMTESKLDRDHLQIFRRQRDDLARSLWTYVEENALFEAVENFMHMRLYRRYDKHYQTFALEPSEKGKPEDQRLALDQLLSNLRDQLDRGEGYDIDRFDIPEESGEPAAEMYLLFHPKASTSVREINDEGHRSRIYFRPHGEATIFYTPSTGRVHVRAGTRKLRHIIAKDFAETVLAQPLSSQPVDFQAYDITRFFSGFDLAVPEYPDVAIRDAKVIRADISVANLATRLSLTTTIDQDLSGVIASQPGLDRTFARAVAVRFIEIAVRYRCEGRDAEQTLDFTLTDRNTSSLLSLGDPFERVLGHRLLRDWGILREARVPERAESAVVLPAILDIWDTGTGKLSGAWLHDRGIDPDTLMDLGFLVPVGWDDEDLIDDEPSVGQTEAEVIHRPDGPGLRTALGHEAPGGSPARYRSYRVRDGWVAGYLRKELSGLFDVLAVEELNTDLLALGSLRINERDVPVYLVRRLDDERVREATDTALRARSDQGIGLVLQAGHVAVTCLGTNVLTPIRDHIADEETLSPFNLDSVKAVFSRNRSLARGGETVSLERKGEAFGTLFVPGAGTISISGANRLLVIERLVHAHNTGHTPMATADMIKGMEDQSLSNIFGQPLWDKLKADFIRSVSKGKWEVAV